VRFACALLAAMLATGQAAACDDGAPCAYDTELGRYHAALPAETNDAPILLLLHGAGGSGRGVLGVSDVVEVATARGYAVIAPDAQPWGEGRRGGLWSFLPSDQRPRSRDEGAFLTEVVEDAAARFGLDAERTLLAGFSAGGFMVSYLACEEPERFPAYAPVAGGFWRPHPERCAGPVRLLHVHGLSDGVVPLEGRPLGGGRYLQGDIFEGMALWRAANGCTAPNPDLYFDSGKFMRRRWSCAPGTALELALHPGGHRVPDGWTAMALNWFEALPDPSPSSLRDDPR
jgi:polyhydroxybutyrate depolymerase